MSRRNPRVALEQMRDHVREILAFAEGRQRRDLDIDRQFELAMVRLLEIIGEAATRVPGDQRSAYPDIPWSQLIGLRNHLIHGYDSVDRDILWRIVVDDLPKPMTALDVLLSG